MPEIGHSFDGLLSPGTREPLRLDRPGSARSLGSRKLGYQADNIHLTSASVPLVLAQVQFSIVEVAALAQAKAQESLCSEAALCIRWAFQKGFVVIPKSVNPQRIQGNIKALSGPGLTPRQMQEIDLLDQGFCSCPAARAMQVPWEEVATKAPVRGKGKGKSKSKGKASGDLQTTSWAEAFS